MEPRTGTARDCLALPWRTPARTRSRCPVRAATARFYEANNASAGDLDGTRLWRIDLGRDIRCGAHCTQFQVRLRRALSGAVAESRARRARAGCALPTPPRSRTRHLTRPQQGPSARQLAVSATLTARYAHNYRLDARTNGVRNHEPQSCQPTMPHGGAPTGPLVRTARTEGAPCPPTSTDDGFSRSPGPPSPPPPSAPSPATPPPGRRRCRRSAPTSGPGRCPSTSAGSG
ncbi:rhamnogalacturonan lyase family protein [Streptomyces dangxiongensis]|uniref:rhamnogalacturonan lyase family protein n=1 Tax=Streptomyces dangxiongensis TaxID=1442032 RepID=UPI0037429120